MTTLREAVQQFVADYDCGGRGHFAAYAERFRALLAQEEREPVAAWMYVGIKNDGTTHGPHLVWKPQYMDAMSAEKGAKATPLYTHPPRREWQSLTEEEMEELLPLYSDPNADAEMLEFASAIETKLKEKNNA